MYTSILELVGNTPLLELKKFCQEKNIKSQIFGKLEFFNPSFSVKDRAVKYILEGAIKNRKLKEGYTIIEATSGNTGISLACLGKALGYNVIIVMPDSMSEERRKLIVAYGAKLVLTPGRLGMQGAVDEANRLHENNPKSIILGQFTNMDNVKAHYETTAVEIYQEISDVDYIVAGVGSGGTITGIGKYVKEHNLKTKIVAVEPAKSPLLSTGKSAPHGIQGIGPNFIPDILDLNVIDEVITISEEETYQTARDVRDSEGLLLGISSAAALNAASKIIKKQENKKVVVIFPDDGIKYLSTDIYK